MKKILALILAIMMVLSLCACGTDTEVVPVDDAPVAVVDVASDEPTGEPTEEIAVEVEVDVATDVVEETVEE